MPPRTSNDDDDARQRTFDDWAEDQESGESQTNRDSMRATPFDECFRCDMPIGAEGEHKWTITAQMMLNVRT